MTNFFSSLDFSLPTALTAEINGLSYEDYIFEVKIVKHKDNPRRLAQYVAEYIRYQIEVKSTDKPVSKKVRDIIKPHLRKSSNAVFYRNDKGEWRGFNFK
tara:strand:+ start:168 stop:467 length:300 start_codon:yes stop_codon:yes gene_type:complete